MTRRRPHALMIGLVLTIGLAGCSGSGRLLDSGFSYSNLPVAEGSVAAGEGHSVLFKGSPLMLSGTGVKVGDQLRDVKLTDRDLAAVNIAHTAGSGKVRIISIVPSLDTKVCEQQTHQLSEKNHGLDKLVELITVSIDTPFAQKRFAAEAKIANVTFLSDYRGADFGKTHGLFLRDPHILARAVMVVDAHNVIRYLEITPELAQLPNLDEAFKFARSLVTAS